MSHGDGASRLIFRPGRVDDHAAVVDMTRDIWGGEDYLASVWEEWVTSPDSHLAVGLLDGQLVASGRLVALAEGEWWLEGMRVHPEHQGRGFSSHLHDHLVDLARKQPGMRTLGLATSSKNKAIMHLARRSGMVLQGEYRMLKRQGGGQNHPQVASPQLPVDLCSQILSSTWCRRGGPFLMDGWKAHRVTDHWLASLIARGARLWRYGDALALAGPEAHRDRWWLYVMAGGGGAEQRLLAEHIAGVACEQVRGRPLRCLVPDDPALLSPLQAAGFGDPWDGDRGTFYISHFVLRPS